MNITTNEFLADHYFGKNQLKKVIKESKRLNIATKNEELLLRYLMLQDFRRQILLITIDKIEEKGKLVYYEFQTNKSCKNYCTGSESIEKGIYDLDI